MGLIVVIMMFCCVISIQAQNDTCIDIPPFTRFDCEFEVLAGACDPPHEKLIDSSTGLLSYCLVSCGLCDIANLTQLDFDALEPVDIWQGSTYVYPYAHGAAIMAAPEAMAFRPAYQMAASYAPVNTYSYSYSYSYAPVSANFETLGFAVGGARGVENFRRNVQENYLPLPQDLTYEGIFNDYYFDTTNYNATSPKCEQLFCPAYSAAITPDPLYPQSQNELYLAVGLDSGLLKENFSRKNLNLVIVLDVSGSMDSKFNQYAYDSEKDDPRDDWELNKLEVAIKAIIDMLQHLKEGDRLSIVTFESYSDVLLKLTLFEDMNWGQLQERIGRLRTTGGTDMEAGYLTGTEQLQQCEDCMEGGLERYENRIIFLTDAQPNLGDISSDSLSGMLQRNSNDDIFTTVIGIGLDFNSELIETITKTRGANYYSVFSPSQFRKKMDEEFDFMVTPLVFDLKLEIDPKSFDNGTGWQVIKVYGSPNIDGGLTKNGSLIEINTLFPTPRTQEGIKGGVILLKMFKPPKNIPLQLKVSYQDRDTLTLHESFSTVNVFENLPGEEFFGSTGVEKAVLLSRYVDLIRGWLMDQHDTQEGQKNEPIFIPQKFCEYYRFERKVKYQDGCDIPVWIEPQREILPVFEAIFEENFGRWERTSLPLEVSEEQGEVFLEFLSYLEEKMSMLEDDTLEQEVDILSKLIEISN